MVYNMQFVEQHEIEHCLFDCTNTTIRIFDAESGALIISYYLENFDIAIEVKEGYFCLGNMHTRKRLKRVSAQLSTECSLMRFSRSQQSLSLILRKCTPKNTWEYWFALERTPVRLAIRNGWLSISYPASYSAQRVRA